MTPASMCFLWKQGSWLLWPTVLRFREHDFQRRSDFKVHLFCRTYLPNRVSQVVGQWREFLKNKNHKAAASLADPKDYPNLFPGHEDHVKTEQFLRPERTHFVPAHVYSQIIVSRKARPTREISLIFKSLMHLFSHILHILEALGL